MTVSLHTIWRNLKKPASPAKPLLEPQTPAFSGKYAAAQTTFSGELKIISWNIRLSERITADIRKQGHARVIAGGDFNTLWPRDIRGLDTALGTAGLERISAGSGPTARVGPWGLHLDHIFIRGLESGAMGVSRKTSASDHLPLWMRLSPTA